MTKTGYEEALRRRVNDLERQLYSSPEYEHTYKRIGDMEKGLSSIAHTLGPPCEKNECYGCREEMVEARRIASKLLEKKKNESGEPHRLPHKTEFQDLTSQQKITVLDRLGKVERELRRLRDNLQNNRMKGWTPEGMAGYVVGTIDYLLDPGD